MVEQVVRATGQIDERGPQVDAQVPVERGKHFLEMDGPAGGRLAEARGRSDHLSGPPSPPGQQSARDARAVIASRRLVDLRGTAEFPPGDHCAIRRTAPPPE